MAIRDSILKCKKSIGKGVSREAYYSKKYNLVYKKKRKGVDWRWYNSMACNQNEFEAKLFETMTEEEKEIFPIVGVEYFDGEPVIIMKPAVVLKKILLKNNGTYWNNLNCNCCDIEILCQLGELINDLGLVDNSKQFLAMIRKYKVYDLHEENVGICENRLVIIDLGMTSY